MAIVANAKTKKISDAEKVYDFIVKHKLIGQTFTARELFEDAKLEGLDVTYSALTAFLTRAHIREMISVVGTAERGTRVYKLDHKPAWEFGHKTTGSKPGRTLHKEPKDELIGSVVSLPEGPVVAKAQSFLSGQLIDLAAQIEMLENKPVVTLADFSTDELMEELKRRLK